MGYVNNIYLLCNIFPKDKSLTKCNSVYIFVITYKCLKILFRYFFYLQPHKFLLKVCLIISVVPNISNIH